MSKVTTGELFTKGFKFPDVARHDFAQQQLDEVEISEKNLNNNIDNDKLLESFTQTANKIKKTLVEKYGDSWVDPSTTADAEDNDSETVEVATKEASKIKDEDVDIDV